MDLYQEVMVALSESVMKISLVMESRRPIFTFQLTCYATESNAKKCCFMRATHAIYNIYKLICFMN